MKILIDECVPRDVRKSLIRPRSNKLVDLLPYMRACAEALRSIRPGEIVRIGR